MTKRVVELLVAVAVGIASALALMEGWSYRGQSSYMPVAVSGFALFLSLAWAIQSLKGILVGDRQTFEVETADFVRFAVIVGTTIVYVLGVTYLGFFGSTLVMVPALAFAMGYRDWKVAAVATLVFVAVLYAVFRALLSIPLPYDALLNLLGIR